MAAEAYIEMAGQTQTDLLCEEMMSDYASGPEHAIESKEAWKLRMAKESKIDGASMPAQALTNLCFGNKSILNGDLMR